MDDYKIIKYLNEGAFGKIYLVEKKSIKKHNALKSIKISNIDHYSKLNILNEIKVLLVHDCKYILKCTDLFMYKKKICIITDYIDGGDLINYKKRNPIIKNEELDKIFLMIISAISSLHSNNIIHRDLKPANILITKTGDIKICDFGISKQLIHKNGAKTLIGTPYCMSPEVINNQNYDYKTDIWGIGCIIYYLVYNKYPFDGKNLHELKHNILNKNPVFYKNNIFNNIILQLLEKNKNKRTNIFDLTNKNLTLFQKYNISINNSKYKKYNIKSIPYCEYDWKSIISKIVNDNNLSSKKEILKKTDKIERKKWDLKEENVYFPKINYNNIENKHISNSKQMVQEVSPPLPVIKQNPLPHHRRTPMPPPGPPPRRTPMLPPGPPPGPPPRQSRIQPSQRENKINQDAQKKMNEFRYRRYTRINNENKNIGIYNDGIGQKFYRNNNINWISGLRRY